MRKAVLISTRPKWCNRIAREEKLIKVKKAKPKIELPFECFIYCTKGKTTSDNLWITDLSGYNHLGNDKVIGEFICDAIVEYPYPFSYDKTDCSVSLTRFGCLSVGEVWEYGKGKTLYGWHISDLKIYDEPRELSEFYKPCPNEAPCALCKHALVDDETFTLIGCENKVTRPPHSWCYVEKIK